MKWQSAQIQRRTQNRQSESEERERMKSGEARGLETKKKGELMKRKSGETASKETNGDQSEPDRSWESVQTRSVKNQLNQSDPEKDIQLLKNQLELTVNCAGRASSKKYEHNQIK